MGPHVVAFASVAALLTIAPGADTALVTKFALTRGRRAAFAAIVGIATGCAVHATFSALGLSVVLARSASLYHAIKLAGAMYLVYLGARTLWSTRSANAPGAPAPASGGETSAPARDDVTLGAFATGLLTNLLNPKVAIFYLTFLPQFVDSRAPVLPQSLTLAAVHILMGLVWLGAFVQFLSLFRTALERPGVKRWMERATGAVLVAFGVKIATARE
jgi:RhtB (resistance to homoserine/threonine) family protein